MFPIPGSSASKALDQTQGTTLRSNSSSVQSEFLLSLCGQKQLWLHFLRGSSVSNRVNVKRQLEQLEVYICLFSDQHQHQHVLQHGLHCGCDSLRLLSQPECSRTRSGAGNAKHRLRSQAVQENRWEVRELVSVTIQYLRSIIHVVPRGRWTFQRTGTNAPTVQMITLNSKILHSTTKKLAFFVKEAPFYGSVEVIPNLS